MGQDPRLSPFILKEQCIAQWSRRRLGRLQHERRVLALADELFRLLRPLHGLGAFHRRILRSAALVHDVGRAVNDRRHPQLGCAMLRTDRFLPLTPVERRALMYLTRYHRGAVPEVGFDDILESTDPRRPLRTVLAILRAADALDGRQHHPPIIRFKLREDRLKIRVELVDDTRRARKFFSRRKKFRLLEELLDVKVETSLRAAAVA